MRSDGSEKTKLDAVKSQHAIIDELEWARDDAKLDATARDAAIGDLIELIGAVDGLLQLQAGADAEYFFANAGRTFTDHDQARVEAGLLDAYRWQYIVRRTLNGVMLSQM